MFEQDIKPVQVAHELRVSTKSAYQWRRRWRAGGSVALVSKGAGGAVCRLAQLARLLAALDQGPAGWGWAEDQRWTLERVTALIGRLFQDHSRNHGANAIKPNRASVPGHGRTCNQSGTVSVSYGCSP